MRRLAVAAALMLSACAGQDTPEGFFLGWPDRAPEFGVTRVAPGALPASHAEINNQGDGVLAAKAARICTIGNTIGPATAMPGGPGGYEMALARCNLYRPTL